MSERFSPSDAKRWDLLLKAASILCTAVVVPGIGWAWNIHGQITELSSRVAMLSAQMDSDRRGVSSILEEIKSLRVSVDTMRTDLLQRMTRVETRLDQSK
jgi:hypothetical protein